MAKGKSNRDISLGIVFFKLCQGSTKQEIADSIKIFRQSLSRRIIRLKKEHSNEELKTIIIKEITELDVSKIK